MTFEKTIKSISTVLASLVIYVFALMMYLNLKGFSLDANGDIVLVNSAIAKEVNTEAKNKEADERAKALANINIDVPHFLGKADAPVTIYEYSSYACSHCSDFHLFTLPKLKQEFIEKGLLKLVFVDFPLDKKSMQGAMLSYCIPAENYFEYLDIVFKNQREWAYSMKSEKVFTKYANLFGLSNKEAEKCMKDDETQNRILANRQQALDTFKLQGTPSFVLANKYRKEVIHGAVSYDDFKNAINKLIEEK